jgi:site-specific DNA-methyltransferase (adenine-specific)
LGNRHELRRRRIKEIKLQLFEGDCLEIMKQIPDGSVDMILCDLPYGTTECKWDAIIPFSTLWIQYERVAKENAAIALTASQPFTSALVMSNPLLFRTSWIWVKTNCTGFANAKKQPLRSYEDVLVFYRRQPTYNPQGIIKMDAPRIRMKETGEIMGRTGFRDGYQQEFTNYPKNVLSFPSERGHHPTQKPIALMEYLIRTYTNEGDTVLDNCMGSGTTGVACTNLKRRFIGIEKDPEYFRLAKGRIEQAQNAIELDEFFK